MVRMLIVLLVFTCALVPPGICSCRLQDLLFPGPSDSCPAEEDDHDCDCARIQQDCVVAAAVAIERPTILGVCSLTSTDAELPGSIASHQAPDRFYWPDSPPLYLTLRALLI
jgi:hypothetical protein